MKKGDLIKNLVNEIVKVGTLNNNKINDYVTKSNLVKTKSEQIIFLKEFVKKHPYPKLYVDDEFLKCASTTKEYSKFIVWLIKAKPNIMDRSHLIEIYENRPELFEFLFKELSKSKHIAVSFKLGMLLRVMGSHHPQRLFDIIINNKILYNIEVVTAVSIQETNHAIPAKIISRLVRYTGSKNDIVRHAAIGVLINKFHKNPKIAKKLMRLARTDDKTKECIVQEAIRINQSNPELYLQLLQQCAKTNSLNHVANMSFYIQSVSERYPIECMDIIKKWLKKFELIWPDQFMLGAAEQIGKTKCFKKIEDFLLEWINIDSKRSTKNTRRVLGSSLPRLIHSIYKNDESHLLSLLEKIEYTEKKKSLLIVSTMETVLSEDYHHKNESFANSCRQLLEKIAIHQNLDVSIEHDIENPVMQTLHWPRTSNHIKHR